jgi:protease secretion system outer membrane protein
MRACLAALLLCLALPAAHASGLVDDFRAALDYEPQWLAAIATRDAGIEAEVQGRAQLLPQVSYSASRGRATTDQTNVPTGLSRETTHYDTYNYTLQIRQPLFRMRAWATYQQGKVQAAYADATLKAARQDLALRVAGAYADWAASRAEVDSAEVQVRTNELLLRSAERSLEGGDGTRVDVETARGRLEQAQARLADAQGQLQAAILNWRQTTGREAMRAPPVIAGSALQRLLLEPSRLPAYQDAAIAASSQIRALELTVDAAREEVRKLRGDHYPTLDLYASHSRNQSDSDVTINQRYDSQRIGLQLNIPIYAGGGIESQVRQAAANLRRAESELEAGKQKLRLQVERDWHAMQTGRANVEAARKVYDAAQLAARAAELGVPAGSATRVDQANAVAQAANARRDLANAAARALFAWARLMASADRLDEDGLRAADAALSATALAQGL